jgi:hypothetical protein
VRVIQFEYVVRMVFSLALLWPEIASAASVGSIPVTESQVKAAYLYNFAKFIAWPERSFAAADAPMEICVLDDMSFESTLKEVVSSHTVDAHPVQVVHVTVVADAHDCHILFIPSPQNKQAHTLIQALGNSSIVTVGETPTFLEDGGVIRFALQEGRIKFQVNMRAAAESGVHISARLLTVATRVLQ